MVSDLCANLTLLSALFALYKAVAKFCAEVGDAFHHGAGTALLDRSVDPFDDIAVS